MYILKHPLFLHGKMNYILLQYNHILFEEGT